MSKTTLKKVFSNKYVQLAALAAGGLALLRNWKKDSVSGVGRLRPKEPFNIPTIPQMLRTGLADGSITYRQAGVEMLHAGYFNYVPNEDEINRYLGIGKVIENDYDGALITTADGLNAYAFDVRDRGKYIDVTLMMKGDGTRYGFEWEFLSHIGSYKTLEGAKRAAKRHALMSGKILNDKDLAQL